MRTLFTTVCRHGFVAVAVAAFLAGTGAGQASAQDQPTPTATELRGMAKVVDGYGEWTDPRFYGWWAYDDAYQAALATDPDPRVAANKRLVIDFEAALGRALVERRMSQDIDTILKKYAAADYRQMDPNIPDGRDGLAQWFKAGGMHKGGITALPPPPVALIGDGDSVAMILKLPPAPDPDNPSKVYSAYLLSVFRVKDGLISTHYSSAMRGAYWCRIDCGPEHK